MCTPAGDMHCTPAAGDRQKKKPAQATHTHGKWGKRAALRGYVFQKNKSGRMTFT